MTLYEFEELKKLDKENDYRAHGDVRDADFILAFSFGCRIKNGKIAPGISNEQLADFIEKELPDIPVIAQFEIAETFKARQPALAIREHREKGKYLGSDEVLNQALDYIRDKGWKKAIIVTHPAMEARNDYACTAFGLSTIAPPGLEKIAYDPQSEQEWTRNPESWWKREESVLDYAFKQGWLEKPKDLLK